MKVGLLTREWPPEVYGGAGVHVVNLVQALRALPQMSVDVHCFGADRDGVRAYQLPAGVEINAAEGALMIDLLMASNLGEVDLIHSHTWYTNMAGDWGSRFHDKPHVITAHSLEPLRPWKEEQLGHGYRISSWAERTAYDSANAIIAVSDGMRADVLRTYPELDPMKVHTIRNGVDTSVFKPQLDRKVLEGFGIPDQPYAIFVGRITRQKGLAHLLRAWRNVSPDLALVLVASSPDEPHIGQEAEELIAQLHAERSNVYWVNEMVNQSQLIALLSQARVAVVPSIYEPLGIVNLEAMACATAVVASNVGGIPEVVEHGTTGELVNYSDTNADFESDLAAAIERVGLDQNLAETYGRAGRLHVERSFSWSSVAQATAEVYQSVLK